MLDYTYSEDKKLILMSIDVYKQHVI